MQLLEYEQAKIPDDEREACTRLSRSYLSAVPHFVSVPGSTSDNSKSPPYAYNACKISM
jgi:hypothetical protein